MGETGGVSTPPSAMRASMSDARDERGTAERGMNERRVTEDREITDDERLAMFRDSFFQSVLPDLPKIPGYHTCWLTTTNPRDTIPMRLRLGYTLIRMEDIPGWDGASLKTGDYAGCVAVNEMIAAKLPSRLYNRYMREVHHNEPLAQEDKLKANMDLMRQQIEARGSRIEEGDGTAHIVQRAPPMPELTD